MYFFYIFVNFNEFCPTPVWPQKMTTFCRCFERQPPWGAQNWPTNHAVVLFLIILGSILGLSWSPSLAPQEGVIFWWMSQLICIFRLFFATPKASRFVSFCHHFYCFLHFLEAFLTHFAKTWKNAKNAISAETSSTFWPLGGFKNVSKSVKNWKKHMNFGSNIFIIFGAILVLLGAQFLKDVSGEMHVFKKPKIIIKKKKIKKIHIFSLFLMIF